MIGIISSGLFRVVLVMVGGGSSTLTCSACVPRRPSATPNSTRWPGFSGLAAGSRAVEWTNTSPPSSRVRKPKPLSTSYHLTLPVGTCGDLTRGGSMHRAAGPRAPKAIGSQPVPPLPAASWPPAAPSVHLVRLVPRRHVRHAPRVPEPPGQVPGARDSADPAENVGVEPGFVHVPGRLGMRGPEHDAGRGAQHEQQHGAG